MRYVFLPALLLFISGSAFAVPVDPNAPDGVAALFYADTYLMALDTNGQTWRHVNSESTWVLRAANLPIPISEVADWHPFFVLGNDGVMWRAESHSLPPTPTIWHIVDPVPIEPVSSEGQSLGDVKSMFR